MGVVRKLSDYRQQERHVETPEAAGKGFALLHRKIKDLPFYKDSEATHLWVHIILTANYEPTVVTTEFGDILLRRGEFITGRSKLELDTGISESRIKYLLNKFEKLGMISRESTKKFTRIFVVKYDDYQLKIVPTECQQSANANAGAPKAMGNVVPTECQQSATENELNNNSLGKPNESASASEKSEKQKSAISCQDVIDAYHEILPEAKSVRALTEKRRSSIKTFWRKAGVVTRQLDGHGFTMDDWRKYLGYVRDNCRWMFEERQNQQRGTVWHKKGFDFLLNDNVYLKVREGDHDDR
ncbi:DNA replication protein [Serratia marcescens]|uniref:DNA replication protein n=1 Tax=Serratia marcescens TaxID=615 RepID=UPI00192BAD40|nr:DNA replication protein [Serratia marcescens]MBL5819899.1 DNA replication protein [Serratia marcescens]